MGYETDRLDRKILRLEKDLKELSELYVKQDEELRELIKKVRINVSAGVTAAEYTLALRLGITMDVVMSLIPREHKSAIEAVIDARVANLPSTVSVAMKVAREQTDKERGE